MPTVSIITLGCKVNQYESEAIEQSLKANGWRSVRPEAHPDLCIINTCTVTHRASQQARQTIRHMIRTCPSARIIVTGCYAQTETEDVQKINESFQNALNDNITVDRASQNNSEESRGAVKAYVVLDDINGAKATEENINQNASL